MTSNGRRQVLRRSVVQRIVDELGYAGRASEAAQYAELMTIVFAGNSKKESH